MMPENCGVYIAFRIYDQFGAIRKPDSRCIVYKRFSFSSKVSFDFTKTEKSTKNLQHSFRTIALSKSTVFAKKKAKCNV